MVRLQFWRSGECGMLLHSTFNKSPEIFVKALKIVIDSWKFSMLLQYILWDDWPIFMISDSEEKLQQQLEYTLLKPDCHSWWIPKMQSWCEEERYGIKFCFKLGKNAMWWKLDLLLWPRDQETEFPVEACWLYRPKKARQSKSNHKLLMIPFFDNTGMIYMHWVPTDRQLTGNTKLRF